MQVLGLSRYRSWTQSNFLSSPSSGHNHQGLGPITFGWTTTLGAARPASSTMAAYAGSDALGRGMSFLIIRRLVSERCDMAGCAEWGVSLVPRVLKELCV